MCTTDTRDVAATSAQIEALALPPGYSLSWGGEFEDAHEAQSGLYQALPVGFLFMIITSILLFGKVRQPLIIWLTVPLAIICITAGLLTTGGAFDFMSILGGLSLVGLLIKNAIVLIEEIDHPEGRERDGDLVSEVDLGHPALAELADDLVMADRLSGRRRRPARAVP